VQFLWADVHGYQREIISEILNASLPEILQNPENVSNPLLSTISLETCQLRNPEYKVSVFDAFKTLHSVGLHNNILHERKCCI
jgi:hypothetical protein